MITEKELIKKLQSLKQVKPRENWVVFTKSKILNTKDSATDTVIHANGWKNILGMFLTKKFAYSFAVLLLVIVGVYSLVNIYSFQKTKNSGLALLAAEAKLKNDFRLMQEKSQKLAELIEKDPKKVDKAVEETKAAIEKVTKSIKEEPSLAKSIDPDSVKNRTYLNVIGREDLTEVGADYQKTYVYAYLDYFINNQSTTGMQREAYLLVRDSFDNGEINLNEALELISQISNATGATGE